jgi:hypothetical protein
MSYDDGFSLVIGFIIAVGVGSFLAALAITFWPSKRKKWNGVR